MKLSALHQSTRKNYRRMRRWWQQIQRKKVQQKEEGQTTDKIPKEGCAPQTAAKQEEQDDDMPDVETMDFIKELHNLARKGMRVIRNCPPEKNCMKLLSHEERKEAYMFESKRSKFLAGT